MLQAAEAIQVFTKGGKAKFMASDMAQSAVERQLGILGEAARRLSDDFRSNNPEMPWRSMILLRNVLVHGYDGIDVEKVWDAVGITVNQTLPLLRQWLQE